jgi:ADP-ribose pyrophosphatase YjhB (NUDIX family)
MLPRWFEWARSLQSIAQIGLAYTQNPFDVERYQAVLKVATEILAAHTELGFERLEGLFNGEEGYATPKVDVRGAAFQNDRILLVREISDGGRWTLPGGWADVTDTPSEAVIREIWEESGFEARVVKLAMLYDRNRRGHPPIYFSAYKLFFLCELTGGAATASIETSEVGFFPVGDLPELSIARVTPAEIQTLYAHHRNPALPTDFD